MVNKKEQIIYRSEGVRALIEEHEPQDDFQTPENIKGFEKKDGDFGSVIFFCREGKNILVEATLGRSILFSWRAYLVGPNIRLVPELNYKYCAPWGDVPEEKNLEVVLMKLFGVKPIEITPLEPVVQMPDVPWQPKHKNYHPYFCFASEAEEMFELFEREKKKIEKQIVEVKE